MKRPVHNLLIISLIIFSVNTFYGRNNDQLSDSTFAGLKLRSIGPAFMAGRIADIAIHPDDFSKWYVAVGSGGVWLTENAGTTWKSLFDGQSSYSIGCVTIDPHNPQVIWVGTGENVGGRHVAYGDGVYRSIDGGDTWENMGLKESYHISKIIVHPENPAIIYVAAQGMLWNKGGERGLYRSVDGGKTWKQVLGDKEWVGVTDVVIDPRNPDWMYAATWQRHRTVAAYMGGGPGSGIHRSTDGGNTWIQLKKGLPESNMGKIGLAISPQRPDVIYAAIELDRRTGGVFRSENQGMNWKKMSEAVAGATGPHYYQELYTSPHKFDRLYLVDVRMQVSEDGGKTFRRMNEKYKHSDNHSVTFRPDDPDYLLVGTDGGIYESFDLAENWRFVANLPITQFYKLALDDTEPFYNIIGGTQDNNTQIGPSRTDNVHGIRNADWGITLGGDGHQPATEPGNPDIVYSEWQQGNLTRIDRLTGETVFIKPQPGPGEPHERFNWDAPILVSPHKPTRLYFASQRVWRSEDRGDSWTPISADLTRNQERITLPIMGRSQSWDNPWDMVAMSTYNTITSLAESPLQEGLIYAGTDDGIVQVTENGGQTWRKIEVDDLPGVPGTAFVNDIKADLHDVNTVYIVLDNHKYGDLAPYLLKSTNRGKSWESLRNNLPGRTLVWRIVQDHVKKDLLFLGTEFGIYFTIDGGEKWIKLIGDAPTISFRDLAIHKRENDLVGASFGRSFYVLDDYSVLREVSAEMLKRPASLFSTRKAWWYFPKRTMGGSEKAAQGAAYFTAKNPPFGAVFTYFLSEGLKSKKALRQAQEAKLDKAKKNVAFAGWDGIEAERREAKPIVWLVVRDEDGNVVRRIRGPVNKGFHRVAWDLRFPATRVVEQKNEPDDQQEPNGIMAAPGNYSVTLYMQQGAAVTELAGPQSFVVERLYKGALPGADTDTVVSFWKEIAELQRQTTATSLSLKKTMDKVERMGVALSRATVLPGDLDQKYEALRQKLFALEEALSGNRSKAMVGEKRKPTIGERMGVVMSGTYSSAYGPTPTHRKSLDIAKEEFSKFMEAYNLVLKLDLPQIEKALLEAGAPAVE